VQSIALEAAREFILLRFALPMAEITIAKIGKSFGVTRVLTDVDLSIQEGEFLTLVGPSGCGKSTLLRIIAGLEHQDEGSVLIGDQTVDDVAPKDRDLAMVFQSYALYPHLTVAGNMAVPLRMRRHNSFQRLPLIGGFLPGSERTRLGIERDVLQAAKTLGIEELLDRKPGQLSGGQRQRVALGRAMVRQPVAFLMDEPLSNLDAALRLRMRAELVDLHRDLGTTFIYVTHDQAEAMTMSDRIAVMMAGEILQCAPPDEIYNNPADIQVAQFIGAPTINLLPAEIDGDGDVRLFGVKVGLHTSHMRGSVKIGIRPEALTLSSTAAPLRGALRHLENLGAEVFAQIEIPALDERIVIRLEPKAARGLALGDELALDLDDSAALLFDQSGKRVPIERALQDTETRIAAGV
jgi:multiple sugar transport system ATP-binding protein